MYCIDSAIFTPLESVIFHNFPKVECLLEVRKATPMRKPVCSSCANNQSNRILKIIEVAKGPPNNIRIERNILRRPSGS